MAKELLAEHPRQSSQFLKQSSSSYTFCKIFLPIMTVLVADHGSVTTYSGVQNGRPKWVILYQFMLGKCMLKEISVIDWQF